VKQTIAATTEGIADHELFGMRAAPAKPPLTIPQSSPSIYCG
jgi:hypothetical protein